MQVLKHELEMKSETDYIYSASNTKLAEMLLETAPYSLEWNEIRNEAARRLKASDRQEPRRPFFNDEEFNV